jgi:hypothetical protein
MKRLNESLHPFSFAARAQRRDLAFPSSKVFCSPFVGRFVVSSRVVSPLVLAKKRSLV